MTLRAWVVGLNETAVVAEGWYDRSPDWFGHPFRESFPTAVLNLPVPVRGCRITLLVGSYRALFEGEQEILVKVGNRTWKRRLPNVCPDRGWQTVSVDLSPVEENAVEKPVPLMIQTDPWRHGDYEPVEDFRPVGILLGAVFVTPISGPVPDGGS